MMVIFISQCQKNALKRTRRVLDSFANRIGDNTWQTLITQNGLDTVRSLLAQTASKNTAVSCHWIRSRSYSELLWIVGNKSCFNEYGEVPVHYTEKETSIAENTHDWKFLPHIKTLSSIAALMHDWGKSWDFFQKKLIISNHQHKDPIRHEWISAIIFTAIINLHNCQSDEDWIKAIIDFSTQEKDLSHLIHNMLMSNTPIKLCKLPPIAQLIVWLIISHHRLPVPNYKFYQEFSLEESSNGEFQIGTHWANKGNFYSICDMNWGYINDEFENVQRVIKNKLFKEQIIFTSEIWRNQLVKALQELNSQIPDLQQSIKEKSFRYIISYTRLALMLGDYNYSSEPADENWNTTSKLYANTNRETKECKQKLDEHLVGVAKNSKTVVKNIPKISESMPRSKVYLDLIKTSPPQFEWQNIAVKKIKSNQKNKKRTGSFIINMASTGCGKTIANAKIMQAFSDDKKLRFTLALGLRTLTLQTGDEFRDKMGISSNDLGVLIGSKPVLELHNKKSSESIKQSELLQDIGSESLEPLLEDQLIQEDNFLVEDTFLKSVLKTEKCKKMLYAPVLVCTIDHLMPATECIRGGKYILPFLRISSADLIIDEVDDFDGSDLIAIGRLIFLAGMLGRKVVISSATIPPAIAKGFYLAYDKGWDIFSKTQLNTSSSVDCLWIDEFSTSIQNLKTQEFDLEDVYLTHHKTFVDKRTKSLENQTQRRLGKIVSCKIEEKNETVYNSYFQTILQQSIDFHKEHHIQIPEKNKMISFGVIRMANVQPTIELSQYLLEVNLPDNYELKIMTYHSKQVLLLRSMQESHLDQVLKRKEHVGEDPLFLSNNIILEHISKSEVQNIMFILICTPVEEVGRDHCFDWAIIEPSSFRSIIQMSGRVLRHRSYKLIEKPNIGILQFNLKFLKNGGDHLPCFQHPGFESKRSKLTSHNLKDILQGIDITKGINAIPRIEVKNKKLRHPKTSLVDLEHISLEKTLLTMEQIGAHTHFGYIYRDYFITGLPQMFHSFRADDHKEAIYYYIDSKNNKKYFSKKDTYGKLIETNLGNVAKIVNTPLVHETYSNRLWLERSFEAISNEYAEKFHMSIHEVCERYGELMFKGNITAQYDDNLGLIEK